MRGHCKGLETGVDWNWLELNVFVGSFNVGILNSSKPISGTDRWDGSLRHLVCWEHLMVLITWGSCYILDRLYPCWHFFWNHDPFQDGGALHPALLLEILSCTRWRCPLLTLLITFSRTDYMESILKMPNWGLGLMRRLLQMAIHCSKRCRPVQCGVRRKIIFQCNWRATLCIS